MATAGVQRESAKSSGSGKLTKIVLIVLVPSIAAIGMVGAALQLVGVPVWQTTQQLVFHHSSSVTGNASTKSTEASKLTKLQQQVAALRSQNQSLKSQLAKSSQHATDLQTKLTLAQNQLSSTASADAAAKKEGQILAQMDPSAAAGVLAKLDTAQAALVLSGLSSDVSAAILADMSPKQAGQLLAAAAKDASSSSAATSSSANATAASTSGATASGTTNATGTSGTSGG